MEAAELRRGGTLLDHLVGPVRSSNLRDLLQARDDDGDEIRRKRAVAGGGRTLFDIIREEQAPNGSAACGGGGCGVGWRPLKDLLRLRLPSAAAPASDPELVPSSSRPNSSSSPSISRSAEDTSASGAGAVRAEAEETLRAAPPPPPAEADGGEIEQQPVRVSLMALLEETDRHWRGEWSFEPATEVTPATAAAAAGEEAEDEKEEEGGGIVGNGCCVCMVRRKGAAFIPCGHTFCRVCARELWAGRSSCPLCNATVLDILDIF